MARKTVRRMVLDDDSRAMLSDVGVDDFRALSLLARSLKKAGLHCEVDPAPDPTKLRVYAVRRDRTTERAD